MLVVNCKFFIEGNMAKIRVIHICDKFGVKGSSVHGVSRLFSWWLPRFDEKRFDVQLVGLRSPDKSTEELTRQGVKIISLNRGKFDFGTIRDIVRLIRGYRADIVHLHGYGSANFGRIAGKNNRN